MDHLINCIISGIIFDLIKTGTKLTVQNVFGGFWGQNFLCGCSEKSYQNFVGSINDENFVEDKKKKLDLLLTNDEYTHLFSQELYNTNFAKRLDYIMQEVNENSRFNRRLNLEYLGEFLGFDSVNDLLVYYKQDQEPSYKFCEMVADKLGVNREWLKYGELDEGSDRPFRSHLPSIRNAEELLKHRVNGGFTFHFLIYEDVNGRWIIVVKKYNEIKYEYYPTPFVFNSQVGATGASYLVSLYNFLKELDQYGCEEYNVHFLDKTTANNILTGKLYCGVLECFDSKGKSDILDDFKDIYGKHNRMVGSYAERYGDDFVVTQEIVANKMKC